MKAKIIMVLFLTAMLTLIWSSAAWAFDRFNTRDHQQNRRIRQGIRSGQITHPELRRLKREQRHIDRAYGRALADGCLNRHERCRLDNMQDRASRHIYRAKHNRFRQHPKRYYHHGDHRACYHRQCRVYHPNKCRCYPPAKAGYFDGYAFSAGVSDMGWQFAFSSGSSL